MPPTGTSVPLAIWLSIAVESKSPAERTGIEVGDMIMEVDGTRVHTSEEMMKIIRSHVIGETVELKTYRIPGLYSVQEGEYLTMYFVLAILDA